MMLPSGVCNYAIRTGGFGPREGSHLTSCFNDVVLTPIPTWLLLLIGVPLVFTTRRNHNLLPTPRRKLFGRIISWVYYVLVLAALLMSILEITRLALSHSGIGLLPFNLAGILIAMVLLGMRRSGRLSSKMVGGVLLIYWVLMTAAQAEKVDTLVMVENAAKKVGDKGPSKYPNSDKSLDNYVILGLYAVFTIYELFHLFRRDHANSRLAHNGSNTEGEVLVDK